MVFPIPADGARVATAGEALMDLIGLPDGRLQPCDGGAVYNMTRALGLQGVGTVYLNPLSRDRFGRGLQEAIHAAGVRLAREAPVHEPTSLAVVAVDAQGKASYSFYREAVADRQVSAAQLIEDCQAEPALQVVATGCLALMAEDQDKYLPWLQAERGAGRLVVVDANLRPAVVPDMDAYCASVMHALAQAHVVKASDDDLRELGFGQDDPLEAGRALMRRLPQARWLALTLGAKGAVLMARADAGPLAATAASASASASGAGGTDAALRVWSAQETVPVAVADTVGAGDCFIAGLLAALLACPGVAQAANVEAMRVSDEELASVLAHAVASASLCVMQTGCQPPTREQVLARLRAAPPQVRALA